MALFNRRAAGIPAGMLAVALLGIRLRQVRLAENEDHDPAGWPQEWEQGEPLPDPECHPDFIEIQAWEHLDEFSVHREGIETSTPVRSPGMSDQELYEVLWEASEARASWEP